MTIGVSVVVITYNEEQLITSCLMSILAIDYPAFEVIVVDASTDDTGQLVKSIKDPRLRYRWSQKKGFGLQRNVGVGMAQFPLVAFTDADCIVPTNWLSTLVPKITSGIGAVGGNAFPPAGSGGLELCIASLGFPAGGAIGLDANRTTEGRQSLATCNALFKSDALDKAGHFDETLKYGGEDTKIIEEIGLAGYQICYAPESFVTHRVRSSIKEFIEWNIRRGRAQYHLARSKTVHSLGNSLVLAVLAGCCLSIWIIKFHLLWIPIIILGYGVFLTLFYTRIHKFRLLWLRRNRIGIGWRGLLACVPFLFVLRRLCNAAGGLVMAVSSASGQTSDC